MYSDWATLRSELATASLGLHIGFSKHLQPQCGQEATCRLLSCSYQVVLGRVPAATDLGLLWVLSQEVLGLAHQRQSLDQTGAITLLPYKATHSKGRQSRHQSSTNANPAL